MSETAPGLLLVITGPIGAGKSTVAELVARGCADADWVGAVVDLDDVVVMQLTNGRILGPARKESDNEGVWNRARAVHGQLVASWLRSGVDVVVAHGPIYTESDFSALSLPLPAGTCLRLAILRVPYEVALERVQQDDSRRPEAWSRKPDFLRSTHENFARISEGLPTAAWDVDTTVASAEDTADRIAAELVVTGGSRTAECTT